MSNSTWVQDHPDSNQTPERTFMELSDEVQLLRNEVREIAKRLAARDVECARSEARVDERLKSQDLRNTLVTRQIEALTSAVESMRRAHWVAIGVVGALSFASPWLVRLIAH